MTQEICAYKIVHDLGRCRICDGTPERKCYLNQNDFKEHINRFEDYSLLPEQIKKFYVKYGLDWRIKLNENKTLKS